MQLLHYLDFRREYVDGRTDGAGDESGYAEGGPMVT